MRPERLIALYPRRWRRRYEVEMAELLKDEQLTPQLLLDLVRGAADAYLHPELAGPVLAAAGGGTMQVPRRPPRITLYALALLALLVVSVGGLYAYRAQAPAMPQVAIAQVATDVEAGRVRSIEVLGSRATITLVDGTRRQASVAGKQEQDALLDVVREHNRTAPSRSVELRFVSSEADGLGAVLPALVSIVFTIVPIALLASLVLLLAKRLSRGGGDQPLASRYQWLATLGDLRDRGVLTEEEFVREKRRLLD